MFSSHVAFLLQTPRFQSNAPAIVNSIPSLPDRVDNVCFGSQKWSHRSVYVVAGSDCSRLDAALVPDNLTLRETHLREIAALAAAIAKEADQRANGGNSDGILQRDELEAAAQQSPAGLDNKAKLKREVAFWLLNRAMDDWGALPIEDLPELVTNNYHYIRAHLDRLLRLGRRKRAKG